MHYLDEGNGRPILLMHGNPTWSFLYRKMVPELVASGFRCIVPDMLGYGLSEHPNGFGFKVADQSRAVLALIRSLDLQRIVVFGQDWGGPVVLGAAVQVPESIDGVVLGSTFAWRTTGVTRMVGRALRTGIAQRWMIEGDTFIERAVRRLAQVDLTKDEVDHYRLVATTPELRKAKAVLPRELLGADSWLIELEQNVIQRLGKKRALLIHPLSEGALGMSSVRRFARMIPDHAVVSLPGAGHFFQEDAPTQLVAAIRQHFST